jgi:hypothetical protein
MSSPLIHSTRRRWLLLIGVSVASTFGAAVAEEARVPSVVLPKQTVAISQPIEIGELRNQLELDLEIAPSLEMRDPRLFLEVVLSEPRLYAKLLDAFKSRAESGCSTIYRKGEGKAALETQLCSIRDLSIAFDPKQRAGRLRARARMRSGVAGVLVNPSERSVTLETAIAFKGGSVVFRPTSLSVEGLPRDTAELLLEEFDAFSFFLHRCLDGNELKVEELRLEAEKNDVRIRASSELAASLRIASCLGSEGRRIPLPGMSR